MKKLFSMMMILLIIAGMTVSAFAANSRTFTVSCTGAEGVTVPTETSTFQIAADSNNPDTSKMITITHQEAGRYLIDFPAFTAAGVYKYAITQKEGNSQGVTYDSGTIGFEVLVVNQGTSVAASQYGLSLLPNSQSAKKDSFSNTYNVGNLSISNRVTGNVADRSLPLPFTVTLTATKTVKTPIIYTIYNNSSSSTNDTIDPDWTGSKSITINLKHEDSAGFYKIPAGVSYTIAAADNSYGYTSTFSNGSGTIEENGLHIAEISSVKEASISTGIQLDSIPYIIILALALLGVFLIVIRNRRRSED